MRVAVSGSSGKLGRAVVARPAGTGLGGCRPRQDPLAAFGRGLLRGRPDRLRRRGGGPERDRRPARRRRRARAPGSDSGAWPAGQCRRRSPTTSRPRTTPTPLPCAPACEKIVWASSETVLGLPFDETAAVRTRRRGVSAASEQHLFAGQSARGGIGPSAVSVASGSLDDRFALQQRDERRGLCGLPLRSRLTRDRVSWNLWGYIDARDGAQAVRRALEYTVAGADVFIIANADTVMSRDQRLAPCRGVPRRPTQNARSVRTRRCCRSRRLNACSGTTPAHSWRDELSEPKT